MMKSILTSVLFVFTMSLSFGQTIIVTGSNCNANDFFPVNGTYNVFGTANGKIRYTDAASSIHRIQWDNVGLQWTINYGGYEIIYTNNSTSSTPPATGWSTGVGTCAGKTAPTLSGSGVVLPIELLSFDATTEGAKTHLTWVTASETNNKGFDIERSTDGNTFHSLGQVKGNNKASSYQYVDASPFTTSYYRLKQVDFDGTATYSKVVSVTNKGGKALKLYPTLVSNGILTVDGEGSDYAIYNIVGQQVQSGKTAQRLDVSTLAKGTYILKVGTEQAKFVKQ